MKTIIKIALAAILLTATVQSARAAIKHYTFVDAIHEAMLFASSRTEDQIAERTLELAAEHEIPLDPDNLVVRRLPYLIEIDAPYTDTVDLLPGVYRHSWDFTTSLSVRLLEDTRPRSTPARRR